MAHNAHTTEIPVRRLDPTPPALAMTGLVLTVLGAIVFAAALLTDADRAWRAYLVGWLYTFGIAQGAVMLAVVVTIAKGLWSRTIRRFALSYVAYLPIGFLLVLPILFFGADHIFPWLHEPVAGKEAYLNRPFLIIRIILGLGLLVGLSLYFAYTMLRPDVGLMRDHVDGKVRDLYQRMTRGWRGQEPEEIAANKKLGVLGPLMALTYALGMTFVAWDFVMSLEPHWFSTLIGPYVFMAAFLGGIALTALTAATYARKYGYLGTVIPHTTFHDIGKLTFGFCIFWAYLFFSQYIVIWYGKLPLEQSFLVHRLVPPFKYTSSLVFFCLFVFPFFGLLGVAPKKRLGILSVFASIVLFGLWLERYTLIYPSLYIGAESLPLSWQEIGITPLFIGLVLLAHAWFMRTFNMFQIWQPATELELQGIEWEPMRAE